MTRPQNRLSSNGIPARLMDRLETDGGWLTLEYLAMVLDANPDSVERALQRLFQRDLIEKRVIQLALASTPAGSLRGLGRGLCVLDTRREWRFKTWGEWRDY